MGNFIIDTRIKKLERIKQNLLTLKKNQRGDELTQVNGMIARLKKWNMDLEKEKFLKTPRNTIQNGGNYKSYKELTEAIKPDPSGEPFEFPINKKDCNQDENTDTFCALMRKIKEKKQ